MIPKAPTVVLIHGQHLQSPDWELLVWGTSDLSQTGRIARGIEVSLKEDAQLVIWGTGASSDPKTEKKESEFTRDFALAHIDELSNYTGASKEEITTLLTERSVVQLDTKNTKDETYEALKLCAEKGINTLYLVSSPTHVPRCLLTAIQFQDEFPNIMVCGIAAQTVTDHWHPKDVAIVEPAHRPDRDSSPFNLLAKRMARARKYTELTPKLYADVKNLLDVFEDETKKEL